ncbi:hypothetical protein ABT263_37890 [Kitasatospora sp. NPDC001603]|uniref:hypothetical protein n=1 Tax=Kitasatospora sp. NPDC001603 TaxID=3154388 RepID=UPI003331F4C0
MAGPRQIRLRRTDDCGSTRTTPRRSGLLSTEPSGPEPPARCRLRRPALPEPVPGNRLRLRVGRCRTTGRGRHGDRGLPPGRQYRTFVLLDGREGQEGHMWEAALIAGRHALGNLIVIANHNKQGLHEGLVDTASAERSADKWACPGWDVFHVDGHDSAALLPLLRVLRLAPRSAPAVVIARTHEGLTPERRPVRTLREAPLAAGADSC